MATFVRTASIYIDEVTTPEEATRDAELLSKAMQDGDMPWSGTIVLSDDSEWERVSE